MTTTVGAPATRPVSELPLPPGRLGLPWIGETLAIAGDNHGFYKDRFAQHGPIFKSRLFGVDFVIVSGAAAFEQFNTDPRVTRGGTDPISVKQMFLKSLALVDGEEHHARKDVMLHGVRTAESMNAYLARMQQVWGAHVDRWATTGQANVRADLELASAELTGLLYTGDDSAAHARELNRLLGAMRYSFQALPIPVPGTAYGRALRSRKKLDVIIGDAIERHQQHPERYDDITGRMLTAAQEHGVDPSTLLGDLRHLMFAGQGGFFVPFTLLTMVLGQHPEMRERARAEVRRVSPEGLITWGQLMDLNYLGMLSKEVRRYFAMNSATFFGHANEELEIGGYRVPKGWGMIAAIHITMRSDQVFADPELFDPERFTPENEAALAPGSYVPHGAGVRDHHRCPGEDMVTIAIKIYLTLLLRSVDWSLPAQDLSLTNELFPLPTSGLLVDFVPLDAGADS